MTLNLSHLMPTLLQFLLYSLCFLPLSRPFTVIMSDSGVPSALIDGPQTGFSMNTDGAQTDPAEQEAVYDVMRATGNDWATDIPDVCRGRWHGIECMPDKDNVFHVVSLSFGGLSDDTAFPTCDATHSYISPPITKFPHLRTLFSLPLFDPQPSANPLVFGPAGPIFADLGIERKRRRGPCPHGIGQPHSTEGLRSPQKQSQRFNSCFLGPAHRSMVAGLEQQYTNRFDTRFKLPCFEHNRSEPKSSDGLDSAKHLNLSFSNQDGFKPKSTDRFHTRIIDQRLERSNAHGFELQPPLGPSSELAEKLGFSPALILKGNPMGGSHTIPSDLFQGMKSLMILVLSNMNLGGPIPSSLAHLPNLRVLHLDGNRFNGSIPASFGELKNLSELRLNDNSLTGQVPFGREMVWRMRRKLRLYNNSGLCFGANTGLEDYLDSSPFSSDIGLCDSPKPGSARTVQHLFQRRWIRHTRKKFRVVQFVNYLFLLICCCRFCCRLPLFCCERSV